MDAITVNHLRRVYKSTDGIIKRTTKEVVAVEDVSFEIRQGELFGLLGPNGAGKTTSVKMLTTLPHPQRGQCFHPGDGRGQRLSPGTATHRLYFWR